VQRRRQGLVHRSTPRPPWECYATIGYGTITYSTSVNYGRGPGWITNPVATKRIHDYWTKKGQEGYAKIGWGTAGDFNPVPGAGR
jgi:hypothetical protein